MVFKNAICEQFGIDIQSCYVCLMQEFATICRKLKFHDGLLSHLQTRKANSVHLAGFFLHYIYPYVVTYSIFFEDLHLQSFRFFIYLLSIIPKVNNYKKPKRTAPDTKNLVDQTLCIYVKLQRDLLLDVCTLYSCKNLLIVYISHCLFTILNL